MATHIYTTSKAPKSKKRESESSDQVHTNKELEEFFNSTQSVKQSKKESRLNAHKQALIAAREGKLYEAAKKEAIDENGKRAIGYQIMKNKGLTAHRKKENRNARVKKRNKYEAAKKKIKSVRAVYTGQQGPYQGEVTGISKRVSRSVKLD